MESLDAVSYLYECRTATSMRKNLGSKRWGCVVVDAAATHMTYAAN